MEFVIRSKSDAIEHIEALYPIGRNVHWDKIWLQSIGDFGYKNLPTELLAIIAQKMVVEQGDICVVQLDETD
jgi:hypothetical protein